MTSHLEEHFLGLYRIRLDPEYVLDRHVIEKGVWELHIVQLINNLARPGDICVDVGANAGYHTLAMAGAVGPSGHVYAFEPHEETFKKLLDNIALNPSISARITCEKLALSAEAVELKVFQAGNEPGNNYVSAEYKPEFWNGGTPDDFSFCKAVRLDSYLRPGRRIGLIKADVEGMEYEVLLGSEAILIRDKPALIFETLLENFNSEKIKQLEEFLVSHGYCIYGIDSDSGRLTPVSYPNFDTDSVGIHSSRVPDYKLALG